MASSSALRLASLSVAGFRNLRDQELSPHPRFTLISGGNGQGKTNLVEAVHYALTLRMLRPGKLRELVQHGITSAAVQTTLALEGIDTHLAVRLDAQGAAMVRSLRREQNPSAVDEYLQAGSVVAFTPDDLVLIRGGPERRRRMLDRAIFNRWPAYLGEARTYQRLLKSRNQLLRQHVAPELRESFESQLWDSGAIIILRRQELLKELTPLVEDAFERIGLGHGKVRLHYKSVERSLDHGPGRGADARDLAAALATEAALRFGTDQERGFTSVGPHADDLNITLSGRPARLFASQGQARALVLAIKVAEIENLRSRLGHAPILLLDDVSSELDPARNASLLAYLRDLSSQVLLTTTDDASLRAAVGPECARWVVVQGLVNIEQNSQSSG
jgi:DNA replication and repair protein RecF